MQKDELIKKVLGEKAEIIAPLYGGMMNESYIAEIENKRYVCYFSTAQANEMVDRNLEKENQEIVYGLGLTSKNVYFDTTNGIKINEFIEGDSLNKTTSFDYEKVASIFKKLHSSQILSKSDYSPFVRFDNYEKEASEFVHHRSEKYLEMTEKLRKNRLFLENLPKVLCHNDAQKSNIVKDLHDNYFFIDFEFMANNNAIYDIATFGNDNLDEGRMLLDFYFGGHPTKENIETFYLWRMLISLQWHNVALIKHYRGEGKLHNYNFKDVADYFLNLAIQCNDILSEDFYE